MSDKKDQKKQGCGLFFRELLSSTMHGLRDDLKTRAAKKRHAQSFGKRSETNASPNTQFLTKLNEAIGTCQVICNQNPKAKPDPKDLNKLKALHQLRDGFEKDQSRNESIKKYKSQLKDIINPTKPHTPQKVTFHL